MHRGSDGKGAESLLEQRNGYFWIEKGSRSERSNPLLLNRVRFQPPRPRNSCVRPPAEARVPRASEALERGRVRSQGHGLSEARTVRRLAGLFG